jgi:hypothetical protein
MSLLSFQSLVIIIMSGLVPLREAKENHERRLRNNRELGDRRRLHCLAIPSATTDSRQVPVVSHPNVINCVFSLAET